MYSRTERRAIDDARNGTNVEQHGDGGVELVLTHTRGETADQLWGWVPQRSAVVSADYYQPFLPNAGNGKRRQRHPREWATALTAMADCDPNVVLPMHGRHADGDDIAETYVTVRAIANMAARQYTGWWHDIPSHWRPPTLTDEAAEVVRLAGGSAPLIARALELQSENIRLACQLADWA